MVSIELTNWINNELPEKGSWVNDGATDFHNAAGTLLAKGFSVEQTKNLLKVLYSAVCREFN